MFKPSKTITSHPKVKEVNDGFAAGFDYKYDVVLKDGLMFGSGRMEGCQSARFHTVKDFLERVSDVVHKNGQSY